MSCSQAGATIYGVPTSVHSDGISQHDWEVEGHVGIEDEVASMSQWHKLMSSPAQFKDAFTGEPLTNERCLYNCQELDRAQQLMQAGIHYFKKRMRDPSQEGTFGFYKKARQDSEAHAGGGYTQIWNRLCDAKMSISICVTAPPAETQDVAEENERRLLIIIYQCEPTLQGWCQDIWTSIKEIGTLSQTYIYVRYPYHLGVKLNLLCQVLNKVRVENHTFSAGVVTEGRGQASS